MHLMSSSKLKALFLLPVLLILFSFGEGDKSIPKFPLAENAMEANAFTLDGILDNAIVNDALSLGIF